MTKPDENEEKTMTGTAMTLELDFVEETDPRKRHAAWLIEATTMGWQYGKVNDLDNKITNRYCAYDDLPENKV